MFVVVTGSVLHVLAAAADKTPDAVGRASDLEGDRLDRSALLLRDPGAQAELALTSDQGTAVSRAMDKVDAQIWAVGNLPIKEAGAKLRSAFADLETRLGVALNATQQGRFAQIRLQWEGLRAVLRPAVARELSLTSDQQKGIRAIADGVGSEPGPAESLEWWGRGQNAPGGELRVEENKKIWALLTERQRVAWRCLAGPPFEVSKVKPWFLRAPELQDSGVWVNSKPLRLADLRGHVVVIHFYTFGCVNCQHNYPAYRAWTETFAPKGVTIIGIHTPETRGERDVAQVRARAADSGLTFPILVDNDRRNWNAWGNGVWPAMFLVDKKGYVRSGWLGELNWQGAGGQRLLTQRIETLLSER
jgi:peroxiredoxin